MKKKLTKKEYEYLLECFSTFMPQYCAEMEKSLFIDNEMVLLGIYKEYYIVNLNITEQDRESFFKIYKKFKKNWNKSEENLDNLDFYSEFYWFLKDFDSHEYFM